MVDNFKLIRGYIEKKIIGSGTWKEGDCLYVQLLRRQADDPLIDGKKDKKYHGNMHSRSIKDYLIRDLEHLDDVEEDIKTFCKEFNVRAYIRLNKRSYKKITTKMLKHIAEQIDSGETYASPYHLVASACGMANCAGKNKTWIVDCDAEHKDIIEEIVKIISQCQPNDKTITNLMEQLNVNENVAYNIWKDEHIFTVPTKNGTHLIVQPFNKKMFNDIWQKTKNVRVPDIHQDNPTILFVP